MANQKVFSYFAPPGMVASVAAYSTAARVKSGASFIFISGLAPVDNEGKGLIGFDMYTQTCRVMDIMGKVLKDAGATVDDVLNMHVSITSVDDWEPCCDAYAKYFKKAPTTVLEVVSGYAYGPGQLVQIDAIAAV